MSSTMSYDYAVIDANYLCWRSFYAHGTLSTFVDKRRVMTGMAYGFLQSIQLVAGNYNVRRIVIAWDSQNSRRKGIYAGYKAGRKKDPMMMKDFFAQKEVLFDILKGLPIPQIESDGEEADDVVASLVTQLPGKKLIVGSDHDLFQLLSDDVHMLVLRKGVEFIYGPVRFKQEYGIPPKRYWQVMALTGDRGDGIPGIKGVGEKTAIKMLKAFPGLVKEIVSGGIESNACTLEEDAEAELAKRCGSFDEAVKIIKRARKLTKLRKDIDFGGVKAARVDPKKWQQESFLYKLGKYSFKSMMEGERKERLLKLFKTGS